MMTLHSILLCFDECVLVARIWILWYTVNLVQLSTFIWGTVIDDFYVANFGDVYLEFCDVYNFTFDFCDISKMSADGRICVSQIWILLTFPISTLATIFRPMVDFGVFILDLKIKTFFDCCMGTVLCSESAGYIYDAPGRAPERCCSVCTWRTVWAMSACIVGHTTAKTLVFMCENMVIPRFQGGV